MAKPCVKCGSTEERNKRGACRACKKVYEKTYYEGHREDERAYQKAYREGHREEIAARMKAYCKAHRKERAAWQKAYDEAHRKEREAYKKTRRASDPLYRLKCYIRTGTTIALRAGGYSKESSTADILGRSYEELKVHLEKQFWPGMTWENYGSEWQVDHIIPLASVQTEEETLRLCHYTNLQPLWGDDNLIKRDRLDWTPAESKHLRLQQQS